MECELPRGDCCVERLGRHYGDCGETGERLGRNCGETGERLEWNMERLGERRQFEESWGQEYIMETGGKMDCTVLYWKDYIVQIMVV